MGYTSTFQTLLNSVINYYSFYTIIFSIILHIISTEGSSVYGNNRERALKFRIHGSSSASLPFPFYGPGVFPLPPFLHFGGHDFNLNIKQDAVAKIDPNLRHPDQDGITFPTESSTNVRNNLHSQRVTDTSKKGFDSNDSWPFSISKEKTDEIIQSQLLHKENEQMNSDKVSIGSLIADDRINFVDNSSTAWAWPEDHERFGNEQDDTKYQTIISSPKIPTTLQSLLSIQPTNTLPLMMERGDGFWTLSNKGWRTRREQQDAYRKALDKQIEQRKQIDKERYERYKEATAPTPQVNDHARHLMPWLNTSEQNEAAKQSAASHSASSLPMLPQPPVFQPQQVIPIQTFYAAPSPQQGGYYYVPNPEQMQGSVPMQMQQLPGSAPTNEDQIRLAVPPPVSSSHSAVNLNSSMTFPVPIGQPQLTNVPIPTYGYYGSSPIPPPPAFTQAPFLPVPQLGSYQPQTVQNPIVTQASNPNYVPSTEQIVSQLQQSQPTLNPQAQTPLSSPNFSDKSLCQGPNLNPPEGGSDNCDRELRNPELIAQSHTENPVEEQVSEENCSTMTNLKPHVSQTSEDAPDLSKYKDQYRTELQRQMDERRMHEEERRLRDKEEEERLQRKIQEDQERMRLEYEAEERRRIEKDELTQQQSEYNKRRLEEQKQKDLELKKREQEQRRRALLEESIRNAQDGLKSSPNRYYHTEPQVPQENPWDSKLIPTLEKRSEVQVQLGQSNQNQTNSSLPTVNKAPERNFYFNYDQCVAKTQPNSGSTRIQPVVASPSATSLKLTTGVSKSTEEMSPIYDQLGSGDNNSNGNPSDLIMCPKCAKSFSSNDIKVPKTEDERRNFLNFLENISKYLKDEQEKVANGGFDWRR